MSTLSPVLVQIDMTVPDLHLDVLNRIHEHWGSEPIMYADALREEFLEINAHEYVAPRGHGRVSFNIAVCGRAPTREVLAQLRNDKALFVVQGMQGACSVAGVFDLEAARTMPQYKLDVVPYSKSFAPLEVMERIVQETAAPINAIACDRHGRVFAHPDFQNHARQGLYAVAHNAPHAVYLHYLKISNHHPGLRFSQPGMRS